MKISYIDYDQKYLGQLVALWNETMLFDPISRNGFLSKVIYDPNFDPTLSMLAYDRDADKVIGFCHGIKRKESYFTKGLEETRGWVNFIFVSKSHRRMGVATNLYRLVESKLVEAGVKEITLSAYSPNYMHPGIDIRYIEAQPFFRDMGYVLSEGNSVSMDRTLHDFHWTEAMDNTIKELTQKGISIQNYREENYSALMTFLSSEFDGGWVRNALNALSKGNAEEVILVCFDDSEQIIGFCMRAIDGDPTRFGPIGVMASKRSLGLGGILFDSMMLSMKKEGLMHAHFLWTSGNAIRFYESHGMKIYREYKTSRKVL